MSLSQAYFHGDTEIPYSFDPEEEDQLCRNTEGEVAVVAQTRPLPGSPAETTRPVMHDRP